MVPPYLVTQDGLLNQPRVTVQADSGIASAPHLHDAPRAGVPNLVRGGGTRGLRLPNVPGSQTLTISVSSPDGAQRS